MLKRNLRTVILSALTIASMLGAASPASADHIGFEKADYQVDEAAGHIELRVVSQCCPPATGEFDYYTADLSAIAGADYRQTSGTVFATSCAPCTIRVPIVGDDLFEGGEQFEVKLTNCRAACFNNNGIRRAVVTILDDDPKPSSNTTSTNGSSRQTSSASRSSSTLRSPSPHQSGAGRQPDQDTAVLAETPVSEGDLVIGDETRSREDGDQLAAQRRREVDRSSLPFVALGTLLITGLGVLLWFRFQRAAPS